MNDWLYVDKTEYVWKLVNIRFPNIEVDSSFTGSLVAHILHQEMTLKL